MLDGLRGYLQIASGLTEVTRQRAMAVAKAFVAQGEAGLGHVVPVDLREQVAGLTEELLATSRANRELLVGLVSAEVERHVRRLGLVSAEQLGAATARADRLERRVRDLERQLAEAGRVPPVKTPSTDSPPRAAGAPTAAPQPESAPELQPSEPTAAEPSEPTAPLRPVIAGRPKAAQDRSPAPSARRKAPAKKVAKRAAASAKAADRAAARVTRSAPGTRPKARSAGPGPGTDWTRSAAEGAADAWPASAASEPEGSPLLQTAGEPAQAATPHLDARAPGPDTGQQ